MNMAKPDVLCLQEHKCSKNSLIKFKLKDKLAKWFPLDLQFWNCAKTKHRAYSGTAIFVSKDFKGGIPASIVNNFGPKGLFD